MLPQGSTVQKIQIKRFPLFHEMSNAYTNIGKIRVVELETAKQKQKNRKDDKGKKEIKYVI